MGWFENSTVLELLKIKNICIQMFAKFYHAKPTHIVESVNCLAVSMHPRSVDDEPFEQVSYEVDHHDRFISYTWKAGRTSKWFTLLFMYDRNMSLFGMLLGAALGTAGIAIAGQV